MTLVLFWYLGENLSELSSWQCVRNSLEAVPELKAPLIQSKARRLFLASAPESTSDPLTAS